MSDAEAAAISGALRYRAAALRGAKGVPPGVEAACEVATTRYMMVATLSRAHLIL